MFFLLFLLDDRRKVQRHMDPTDPDAQHWETCPYIYDCSVRQVDVEKYVKALPRRQETSDMTPQLIEEYILETAERGQARVYHTRYLQDVGGGGTAAGYRLRAL
jgi:hypothetical protein